MPNFKMWLSIFKIWVSSVGDLGIRGDGNFDYDFFSIPASVNDTGKISRPCIRSHPIRPCVENDTKEISPAGLAESLCAPPSPRSFQNLVFYFQTLVFFFKILVSSVGESGSRGFFLCQISKCGFLFSKFGFLRSGIWGFGATETLIMIFFQFQRP